MLPTPTVFSVIVKAGFSHARKQIHNSLERSLQLTKEEAAALLAGAGIDTERRAQTLTLEEWARLWRIYETKVCTMITIAAPAKINLTLEVLGKRPDGFHDIRSVVQTINLCDRLCFKPAKSIEITSTSPDWKAGKSLVSQAASLLRESCGCSSGAAITVEKRIPLVAGLGGDSSDAAAVLLGLNQLWKCELSQTQLSELAARLGSDVTYLSDRRHRFDARERRNRYSA